MKHKTVKEALNRFTQLAEMQSETVSGSLRVELIRVESPFRRSKVKQLKPVEIEELPLTNDIKSLNRQLITAVNLLLKDSLEQLIIATEEAIQNPVGSYADNGLPEIDEDDEDDDIDDEF